jgi:hypothetical protein
LQQIFKGIRLQPVVPNFILPKEHENLTAAADNTLQEYLYYDAKVGWVQTTERTPINASGVYIFICPIDVDQKLATEMMKSRMRLISQDTDPTHNTPIDIPDTPPSTRKRPIKMEPGVNEIIEISDDDKNIFAPKPSKKHKANRYVTIGSIFSPVLTQAKHGMATDQLTSSG